MATTAAAIAGIIHFGRGLRAAGVPSGSGTPPEATVASESATGSFAPHSTQKDDWSSLSK